MFLKYHNDTFAEIVDEKFLDILFDGSNYDEIDKYVHSFKMFKETYQILSISLLSFCRGYLNGILDKFILEAHQHGILEYLQRRSNHFADISDEIESKTQVLTLYMLSAGFYVWLITVAITCIAFVGEQVSFVIVSRNEAKKLSKLKNLALKSVNAKHKKQEMKRRRRNQSEVKKRYTDTKVQLIRNYSV